MPGVEIQLQSFGGQADNFSSVAQAGAEDAPLVDKSSPGASGKEEEGRALPQAYMRYLNAIKGTWSDLPKVTVTFEQLGFELQVPVEKREVPNLVSAMLDPIRGLLSTKKKEMKTFQGLSKVTGAIKPGEMTLVLAPPGHGKSLLLKSIAGRLQAVSDRKYVVGDVRWNGLTVEECAAASLQLSKLCTYVDQADAHYPIMTVRETFEFALQQSNADLAATGSEELIELQKNKVDLMLELLGLKECQDTIVGDAMHRGISGGQKKRVTLGEMMITQARVLCLDEFSNGLDAAATLDITAAVSQWCKLTSGSAVVALLQPSPEVFDLFDKVWKHPRIAAGCLCACLESSPHPVSCFSLPIRSSSSAKARPCSAAPRPSCSTTSRRSTSSLVRTRISPTG